MMAACRFFDPLEGNGVFCTFLRSAFFLSLPQAALSLTVPASSAPAVRLCSDGF
jgi:hypothetical protein